eukprot:CAMPEP_0113707632 /NCGR_PEP_ID=MMETSP0038_2-20120614/28511_1 /TAXON_ID=2898 /ORGANISM="Cryptomonas paramecium" /LENGTH=156 /DNA_ID=CAMNT_0000633203 /DNA_START=252 /DNA_END=718 /DNA_ORIENTATION=- /assembly_acc=CAM_ASM_000170
MTNANNLTRLCFDSNVTDSDSSNESSPNNFAAGVLIALLGSSLEQLGLTMWKLAESRTRAGVVHSEHDEVADFVGEPASSEINVPTVDASMPRKMSSLIVGEYDMNPLANPVANDANSMCASTTTMFVEQPSFYGRSCLDETDCPDLQSEHEPHSL